MVRLLDDDEVDYYKILDSNRRGNPKLTTNPVLAPGFDSIARLPFKDRVAHARADLPIRDNLRSPLKLSREEVIAKYSPIPDPTWTPEVEAKFFQALPKYKKKYPVEQITAFAVDTLGAKRMGENYIAALGEVLGKMAEADKNECECLIPQRDQKLGTPQTIRTIQAQMLAAGLLVKETRSQGHGFVGEVFVYRPRAKYRYRKATPEYLESLYRSTEGQAPAQSDLDQFADCIPY
jgi:hypothetical protein